MHTTIYSYQWKCKHQINNNRDIYSSSLSCISSNISRICLLSFSIFMELLAIWWARSDCSLTNLDNFLLFTKLSVELELGFEVDLFGSVVAGCSTDCCRNELNATFASCLLSYPLWQAPPNLFTCACASDHLSYRPGFRPTNTTYVLVYSLKCFSCSKQYRIKFHQLNSRLAQHMY